MNDYDMLQTFIEGKSVFSEKSLPKYISANAMFSILKKMREDAEQKKQKKIELFCAAYELALLESDPQLKYIKKDKICLNKEEYEKILDLVEKSKKQYKLFAYKNLLISAFLSIIIGVAFYFFMQSSLWLSLFAGVLVFLVELYADGKTNAPRYKKKWIHSVKKEIDKNFFIIITKYFR